MKENNRKSIASIKKLPQFTTMNVIDGQAGLVNYSSLIFYSLTIDNILNIIVLLILAGVSIAMLTGNNGILTQANNAKIEQSHGAVREAIAILYNEYQIQINTASNTKLASTEVVTIKGKEEKALANTSMTFLDFLKGGNSQGINYIKEGTDDVLDVGKLTGSGQSLGNGTDTDIYKVEEENSSYIVNYYDINGMPKQIWSIANADNEDDSSKYSVEFIDEWEKLYWVKRLTNK